MYSQRGSLWLDEASLALNVLARDFGALATPLDWGQAAPVGFLWILKALTGILGPGEWVLRLWPFVAGVATLGLTWAVGRRTVGGGGALLATAAIACSLMAIRYSAEAKPYATDALVALALVWAALKVDERPEQPTRWYALGAAGCAGLLLSLPAAFVLAAVGLGLYRAAWLADERARSALPACIAAWLVLFGVLWVRVLQEAAMGAYLREYWAPVMLDPTAPDFVARLVRAGAAVSATPLQWTGSVPLAFGAIAVAIAGVVLLGSHRRGFHALLLAGPAAIGVGASLLGAYPMSDRLAYFAAPLVVLLMGGAAAAAVEAIAKRVGMPWRARALGAAALAVALWVGSDARRIIRAPGSLEPTRALFRGVQADAQREGAPVYLFARATPAWVYATTNWDDPDLARLAFYRQMAGQTDARGHENYVRAGPVTAGRVEALEWPVPRGDARIRPTEILGLAPGVRYRIAGPPSREGPSPGWAAAEAGRIREVAQPAAWVVASHFFEGTPADELRPLVDAIRAAGLTISDERRGGRDAIALRVTAPARPAAPRRRD